MREYRGGKCSYVDLMERHRDVEAGGFVQCNTKGTYLNRVMSKSKCGAWWRVEGGGCIVLNALYLGEAVKGR